MKHLLFLMLFCCAVCTSAQDVIVKKDGSTVVCRVLEVKSSEVIYKLWTAQNGSNYVMDLSLVSSINYESGKKESFSEIMENKYSPYNQSNGERQINDNALMIMDMDSKGNLKKAKRLKIAGYSGTAITGIGTILLTLGCCDIHNSSKWLIAGSVSMPVGGVIAIPCLWKGYKMSKEYKRIQNYALYQQEIKLKNGNSITPSVDMLKYTDKGFNTQTIGMGLSYNF